MGQFSVGVNNLFASWKKKQSRHRTITTYETCVAEFEAIHGALPVASIEANHVQQYRDWLLEAALMKGTADNRIGGLATLFRFGQTEKISHLILNPFEHADTSGFRQSASDEDRRAYSMKELSTIFSSKLYTTGFRPRGQTKEALYWAPIMGTVVGARIEEVAQLRIDDIVRVNGVFAIRIAASGVDQKVKNLGSSRLVPVHRELIACGFLAYVAQQKLKGQERLFPSLKNDNDNEVWSNALTKRYGRYLDEIGLTDPRLDYHSFRYSFRQQLTNCGVESEVRDALTGHWLDKSDSGKTYLKDAESRYPFPSLVAAMDTLRYDELNLGHLHVDNPMRDVASVLTC